MSKGSRQFPDFMMRACAGLIEGVSPLFKFGENKDIDTASVPEDVISGGGIKLFPTAASTVSIVSSSVQDILTTGTGLHSLHIQGLDSNFDQIEESIDLNGTTPVITTKSYLRIHRAYGYQGGSGEAAAGDITLTHDEGTISMITAGHGQTQDATYTVPRDHLILIDRIKASLERTAGGAGAEVHLDIRLPDTSVWREQATVSIAAGGSSFVERDTDLWFPVVEKTDMRIRVTQVATNNTAISAAFDALLIDLSLFSW